MSCNGAGNRPLAICWRQLWMKCAASAMTIRQMTLLLWLHAAATHINAKKGAAFQPLLLSQSDFSPLLIGAAVGTGASFAAVHLCVNLFGLIKMLLQGGQRRGRPLFYLGILYLLRGILKFLHVLLVVFDHAGHVVL